MYRPLTLILATTLIATAPLSAAAAQTWPASVVASAPKMAPTPGRALVSIDRDPRVLRRVHLPPAQPRATLRLSAAEDVPKVDIRPKGDWSDDQGLRVSPTRVAFKRRF